MIDIHKPVRLTAKTLAVHHKSTRERYKDQVGTVETITRRHSVLIVWPKLGCSSLWDLDEIENVPEEMTNA